MENNFDFENDPLLKKIMDNESLSDDTDAEPLEGSSDGSLDSSLDNEDSDEEMIEYINTSPLLILGKLGNTNIDLSVNTNQYHSLISIDLLDSLKIKYDNDIIYLKFLIESEVFTFMFKITEEHLQFTVLALDNLKKYKAIINLDGNYIRLGSQSIILNYNEDTINYYKTENYKRLYELGFDSDDIIKNLKMTNNNFDEALNLFIN